MKAKKTKATVETLGEAPAVITVKQYGNLWGCGCYITADEGFLHISRSCGNGAIECNRERAIMRMIHTVRQAMESDVVIKKAVHFEKAKEILRGIEDSVQPKLF